MYGSRELQSRYQFQPWWVKAYRWVRYLPPRLFVAAFYALKWFAKGQPRKKITRRGHFIRRYSRMQTLRNILAIQRGLFSMDLQHYHTLDEVLNRLQEH